MERKDFNNWIRLMQGDKQINKINWGSIVRQINIGKIPSHKQDLIALFWNNFIYIQEKFEVYFEEFEIIPHELFNELIFEFRQSFPKTGRKEGVNYFDDLVEQLIQKYEKRVKQIKNAPSLETKQDNSTLTFNTIEDEPIEITYKPEGEGSEIKYFSSHFEIILWQLKFIEIDESAENVIKLIPKPLNYLFNQLPFVELLFGAGTHSFESCYDYKSSHYLIVKNIFEKKYHKKKIEIVITQDFIDTAKSKDRFDAYRQLLYNSLKVHFTEKQKLSATPIKLKNDYDYVFSYLLDYKGRMNKFEDDFMSEYHKVFKPIGLSDEEIKKELFHIRQFQQLYNDGAERELKHPEIEVDGVKALAYWDFMNWIKTEGASLENDIVKTNNEASMTISSSNELLKNSLNEEAKTRKVLEFKSSHSFQGITYGNFKMSCTVDFAYSLSNILEILWKPEFSIKAIETILVKNPFIEFLEIVKNEAFIVNAELINADLGSAEFKALTSSQRDYLIVRNEDIIKSIDRNLEYAFTADAEKIKTKIKLPKKVLRTRDDIDTKEPLTFDAMFIDSKNIIPAIKVLNTVTPAIISNANEYVLGSRSKGAITAWVTALRKKSYIHGALKDSEIAPLLNTKFKNLNLGADGRTLRNTSTTKYKEYYTDILSLLP